MQVLIAILFIVAIFNKAVRIMLGITLILYNGYKLLGLLKDRYDIEKIIVINGLLTVVGFLIVFS